MKILLNLFFTLILGAICFAQNNKWVKSDRGDDLIYSTVGTFDNSATKNSKLGVTVMDEVRGIRIYLYEYGFGSPEAQLSNKSGKSTIDVILNGERKEYPVYFTPSSMFFKEGTDFYNLIKNDGQDEITIVVGSWRFNKYNTAQYTFVLKSQ